MERLTSFWYLLPNEKANDEDWHDWRLHVRDWEEQIMTAQLAEMRAAELSVSHEALDDRAREAIHVFFKAEISNVNTRTAYIHAARDFFRHLATNLLTPALEAITPLHVQSWLDGMTASGLAAPTIKLRLAAVRMLFSALVRAQVLRLNPVTAVKGPKHRVVKGKTPVLAGDEAAQLLRSIDTTTLIGLRDRAIIATMAYTFARIGAVSALECRHVFHQSRRLWLRLSEKGSKCLDVPCHAQLEDALRAWMDAAGHGGEPRAPLFQSFRWDEAMTSDETATTGQEGTVDTLSPVSRFRVLTGSSLKPAMAWEMVQRRAKAAGIATHVTNHTFRATGITAYLKNGGTIERAAHIAGHSSTRTTQLYDRRPDDVTIDEIERIRFAT